MLTAGIVSILLSLIIGCCIGFSFNITTMSLQIRNIAVAPAATRGWYDFAADVCGFASVSGVATDIYQDRDVNMSSGSPLDIVAEVRFGLPFKSHSYVVMRRINNSTVFVGKSGIVLNNHAIPMRIDMLLLVANTALIFVCVIFVMIGFSACMHKYRRANGLCIYCSYPATVGIARCPECGR